MRMVLQARDFVGVGSWLVSEVSGGESRTSLGKEGKEGLGSHCAGFVCGREGAHNRVHHPEGSMGCAGEIV